MANSRRHPIPRRDIDFDLSNVDLANWHPKGRHASHYFNVQSLMFPQGERFFIYSVRHFRDAIDDAQLQQQINGFIGQEAMHGREHDSYNAALADIGYPVASMERWVGRMLAIGEKTSNAKQRLAMTAGLEHLTAIGAEDLIADHNIMDGAPAEMLRLWRWHALEETEHKAVAFDVYQQICGKGFISWLRRCLQLLIASIAMQTMTWCFLFVACRKNGCLFDIPGWLRFGKELWFGPGGLLRQFPRYWRYFRPGFHPWETDNYHHVQRWLADPAYQTPVTNVTDQSA